MYLTVQGHSRSWTFVPSYQGVNLSCISHHFRHIALKMQEQKLQDWKMRAHNVGKWRTKLHYRKMRDWKVQDLKLRDQNDFLIRHLHASLLTLLLFSVYSPLSHPTTGYRNWSRALYLFYGSWNPCSASAFSVLSLNQQQ